MPMCSVAGNQKPQRSRLGYIAPVDQVLSPVCSWFAADLDTADLRAARALLDTVGLDSRV